MSIQVHTLKDKDGNRFYPLTHVSAVVDDEGKTITEIVERASGAITSQTIKDIVSITQADYDALETKDDTTLYLITE